MISKREKVQLHASTSIIIVNHVTKKIFVQPGSVSPNLRKINNMRSFVSMLACTLACVGFVACSPKVATPSDDWMVTGSTAKQTVCFRSPGGVGHWDTCNYLDGEDKVTCQGNALTLHGGEVFSKHTKLGLYGHLPSGESKVLVMSGDFSNSVFYCPTIHIRKR